MPAMLATVPHDISVETEETYGPGENLFPWIDHMWPAIQLMKAHLRAHSKEVGLRLSS